MSKTRNAILQQSLSLFNKKGLSNVSLRTIADKMGISVGNLQYHFKKREDIIVALYFQLVEKIDEAITKAGISENILQSFFDISQVTLLSFFDYRFFLLDFTLIIRQHDQIKTHYKQLIILREQQFSEFFNLLISNGLMRDECLPNEYSNLFRRFQILNDFWIASATIRSEKLTKKLIDEYAQVINQSIFPYLTEEGKSQYLGITKY